ncbi:MAG TPA: transposase [Verrucomicrobiae bacterium]|nr:transposase [Verrucomicrobiae bacterium]
MARPLRIEYPGAVYHVMARGNQGRPIFADDRDRERFLETLGEGCEKTGWQVHAYVLMGNHYHLLLETPEGNLVAGMKWLQGAYTQRYNRRHKISGHLFQGRYKAVVVDGASPQYFEVVSTYIHLNPARAGLIAVGRQPLKTYPWSSYPSYLKGRGPAWLRHDRVLGAARLSGQPRRAYAAYIEGRVLELGLKQGRKELEEKWKTLRRGWYLGEEKFFDKLKDRFAALVAGKRGESHSGGAKRAHDESAARQWLIHGLGVLGIRPADLPRLPKGAPEKTALAWWLRRQTTVSLRWVAQELGMGQYTRVTQAVSRMNHQPSRKLRQLKSLLQQKEPVVR